MEVNTTILVISILVAFSGWAKFFYDLVTSKPKISGQIFTVIIGDMNLPEYPNETLTAFVVYLYLVNERKYGVHILDYELEVDSGSGYEKILRVYGVHSIKDWSFHSETELIEIPEFNQKLIDKHNSPIEYGAPLHGFVVFASGKPRQSFAQNGEAMKYKIIIIDAFRNRHEVVTHKAKFPNINILHDLAGIRIKDKVSK